MLITIMNFSPAELKISTQKNPNILLGVFYRHLRKNSNGKILEDLKVTLKEFKNRNKH